MFHSLKVPWIPTRWQEIHDSTPLNCFLKNCEENSLRRSLYDPRPITLSTMLRASYAFTEEERKTVRRDGSFLRMHYEGDDQGPGPQSSCESNFLVKVKVQTTPSRSFASQQEEHRDTRANYTLLQQLSSRSRIQASSKLSQKTKTRPSGEITDPTDPFLCHPLTILMEPLCQNKEQRQIPPWDTISVHSTAPTS